MEIEPNPEPPKVDSKPVKIRVDEIYLELENAPETWDDFGRDISSLIIDGKIVPWGPQAARKYKMNQVHVFNIKQGKHEVQVTAIVDGSTFIARGTIEVKENKQAFKLKLKKTQ